jgi:hypothetical protein|tara:strand:- start:777 stop:998 length:222 start_codon:yes stop_codon:yes gene_type:complete
VVENGPLIEVTMKKTKQEESKELEDQVAEFLKKGGKIEEVDITVSNSKKLELSKRFFAKTNHFVFRQDKKKGP